MSFAGVERCRASQMAPRRRGFPGGPPFGHGSRVEDEHLETTASSTGRPVLRLAVEGKNTLSHSDHHRRREALGTPADSV